MPDYSVFGSCLRSELCFPELQPCAEYAPRRTLRVCDIPPSARNQEVLGEASEAPCELVLYRTPVGFRLWHSCTGWYDVSSDGRELIWRRAAAAKVEMARIDLTGRVFAVALHASGVLCLHGSGVLLGTSTIGFLAAKGWGKSTLAYALVNAGGRLITDDTLAVDPKSPISVLPGVHSLRLRSDSAAKLLGGDTSSTRGVDGKHVVSDLAEQHRMLAPAPLSVIYLLSPIPARDGDAPVRRTLVPTAAAVMSLVRHAKIGALLGKREAAILLDRAVAVARNVPVYTLHLARDLDGLADVVSALTEWHDAVPSGAGT
jgi:hypothetical protein